MAILLGSVWPYMTVDYIYEDMTWAEVNFCLDYVYKYSTDERHWGGGKREKLSDWLFSGKEKERDNLIAFRKKLKAGK